MISNNHSHESPIKGSVRARLLKLLWDETPHQFSELTKNVGKADNVVNRELKILIKKGWVTKPGRGLYVINKEAKDLTKEAENLTKYMQTLDIMPDPEYIYYPLNLRTDLFESAFSELKNTHPTNTSPTDIPFLGVSSFLDTILPHITITVAGKKLEHINTSTLEGQNQSLAVIVDFMLKIALSRLIAEVQEMDDPKTKIFRKENATDDELLERLSDVFHNQDFELVVSWSPEKN